MCSVIDAIVETGLQDRLDPRMVRDNEYIEMRSRREKAIEAYERLPLEDGQKQVVNNLIEAYKELMDYYGEMAYKQGLADGTILMLELESW